MKIKILIHEDLQGIVSKDWIFDHRLDEVASVIGNYLVVISRDDMYNIVCSYLIGDEFADGVFFELDEVDF